MWKHRPMVSRVLPDFVDHCEDTKNHDLLTPIVPPEHVRLFLDRQAQLSPGGWRALRILDVGCGRADTVAWLRSQGWDAYGVDVNAEYIERGRSYLAGVGDDPARLQVLDEDMSYPFADGYFDVVLSDQVIEHVSDLDSFAAEVARVSAEGSVGLHIYPARFHPIEAHLNTPFTHWLPKGRLRRSAEAACLRMGLAAPYFKDYSFADRVEIFHRFSQHHTFYRPLATTVGIMQRHGLRCEVRQASRDRVNLRIPAAAGPSLALLGWLCRHLHSVAIYTVRRS